MIKTGYTVKAGFPKHVMNNEKTVFKVGVKDRNFEENKKWHNVSFMTDFIDVEEKEEVEITEITGFSVNEYKGTPQFTVYGSVKRVNATHDDYMPQSQVKENYEDVERYKQEPEPTLTIDSDDLPF